MYIIIPTEPYIFMSQPHYEQQTNHTNTLTTSAPTTTTNPKQQQQEQQQPIVLQWSLLLLLLLLLYGGGRLVFSYYNTTRTPITSFRSNNNAIHHPGSTTSLSAHTTSRRASSSSSSHSSSEANQQGISFMPPIFLPTLEELKRGKVIQPPQFWGESLYLNHSLRLMTLGGSNTANPDGYTWQLESLILNEEWWPLDIPIPSSTIQRTTKLNPTPVKSAQMDANTLPNTSSYLLNEGVSGLGPLTLRFRFEDWPITLWPNVITMEYMVNCNAFTWSCEEGIETVIQFINHKYKQQGLSTPYYLFFELFRTNDIYLWQNDLNSITIDKLQRPNDPKCQIDNTSTTTATATDLFGSSSNSSSSYLNPKLSWLTPRNNQQHRYNKRGSENALFLTEFARFYRYPVLSVRDAFYPSFVRFFAKHDLCVPWPMTHDGVHLSVIGCDIFVQHIIKPFFHEVIREQHRLAQHQELLQSNNAHLMDQEDTVVSGKHHNKNVHTTATTTSSAAIAPMNEELRINMTRLFTNKTFEAELVAKSPIYNGLEIHFFPNDRYQMAEVVSDHHSWGHHIDYTNLLQHTVVQNQGFAMTYLRNHNDGGHQCLGTMKKDSLVQFDATVSNWFLKHSTKEEQLKMKFQIEIGYLHSWDTTYIGDVECQIYERNLKDGKRGDAVKGINNPIKIEGRMYKGEYVRDSTPRSTILGTVVGAWNSQNKGYLVECRSLLENRLSCFTKVAIYYDSTSSS